MTTKLRKTLFVLPYKRFSEGARTLCKKLGVHRIPVPDMIRGGHHIINWGNTSWDVPVAVRVYNKPKAVALAVDKLLTYQALQAAGVPVPQFTTDPAVARSWITKKSIVFCRTLLKASEGRGIVVAKKEVDIVPAKVYTRYVRKDREYRVHVFDGLVIGHKRKIKRADLDVRDAYIRSHANGYRYICDPENPLPDVVASAGIAAVRALGLDFGGVDIVYVSDKNQAFVLEVNTAPGLTDITGDWYAEAFKARYAKNT